MTSFYRQGQKYKNMFVHFLLQMKTLKSPFEINSPLTTKCGKVEGIKGSMGWKTLFDKSHRIKKMHSVVGKWWQSNKNMPSKLSEFVNKLEINKVRIFKEGHNIWQNLQHRFDTYYIMSNPWRRFRQFLWPTQRYTYRVLQTIQTELILLCVWAEPAVLGSAKTASKFNNFLWVCWFRGKNLSNFVPPVWKLHNPYCRIEHVSTKFACLSTLQESFFACTGFDVLQLW